jgi:hypothetical protein
MTHRCINSMGDREKPNMDELSRWDGLSRRTNKLRGVFAWHRNSKPKRGIRGRRLVYKVRAKTRSILLVKSQWIQSFITISVSHLMHFGVSEYSSSSQSAQ